VITQIFEALKEPFTAIGRWMNPDRSREARKDGAIEAAAELLDIIRKAGKYKYLPEAKLKQYEIHFQKRFNAWRNG
jgi:hypothetical protein